MDKECQPGLHVENARSPQPSVTFFPWHGLQRTQRPDRIGVAETQNLPGIFASSKLKSEAKMAPVMVSIDGFRRGKVFRLLSQKVNKAVHVSR